MKPARILLLCGSSGSGKTTTLLRLLERLKPLNPDCRGIICPPGFTNDEKNFIEIMDVTSGDTRRLAEINNDQTKNLATTRWKLEPNAVDWGNLILQRSTPCNILFMDEIGPLEFDRGEGLVEGFKAVDSCEYQIALVTIRPSLLEKALQRWPDAKVIQIDRENQPATINLLYNETVATT